MWQVAKTRVPQNFPCVQIAMGVAIKPTLAAGAEKYLVRKPSGVTGKAVGGRRGEVEVPRRSQRGRQAAAAEEFRPAVRKQASVARQK